MFNECEIKIIPIDTINKLDKCGQTPLHLAAKNICKDSVQLLLNKGADVLVMATKNKSVLHMLFTENTEQDNKEEECLEILKLFLSKGVKIDTKDSDGKTILHYAAHNKQKIIIEFLLPYFYNTLGSTDARGNTALHNLLQSISNNYRDEEKFIEVIKLILEKNPLLINFANCNGFTPLHIAVQHKQKENMKALLSYYDK